MKCTTRNGVTKFGMWITVKPVTVWLGLRANRYAIYQMDRALHSTQVAMYYTEAEAFAHAKDLAEQLAVEYTKSLPLTDAGHWKA